MEALPRLPMLSFELKHSPEYIEFGPTLKQYIKDHYGEDPALYNKACTDLEQLRQAAIQVSRDFMGCTTLKKYYAQLQYLQGRFPMGEGEEAAIAFTWEDFQTGRDQVFSDIKFEQACILYNIGALHSLLGIQDTRHNAEGMKISCTHFQCAAWAFEHLRDNFGSSSMSTDMSFELLSFHIILMLAQAQECILEKSMIDNRKNNITAKVSAQVVEFYKEASRAIDLADSKQQINSRMHKEWGRRLTMKAAFYQCITFYFLGRQSEESEKPGECLAYYTAAKDELNRATQLAKNEISEVLDCLNFARDVVTGKYESAKKDNDFVYHDKVPAIDTLPEVKGASLVKGIPFNPNDKEISGPDIFQKLVPMEAHEASSVYSEEKAKLSRNVVGDIEEKDMELEQFLSSLQLDVEQLMPKPDLIPENLMEKCAAMSVRTNAIKELTDSMAGVSGLATEVELSISEMQEMMDEDTEKTDQFAKQYGKKNPSSVLPRLMEELASYRKRHEEGSQLNSTLHKAMNTHTTNLKTLVRPPTEIQAMLPPSQPKLSAEDEEVVSEIRRLMQKVNEMREQRKALLQQFRDQIQKDDITNVLVTQEKSDKKSVFAEQLKKHDQVVTYIRQNLAAQDNILRHLTDANAKYAVIKQAYGEAKAKREKMVQDLIMSYEKYEELLAKSQKGVEYYKKLLENVTKTLERCRSECKVRHEEREMLLAKFAPRAPAPSRPLAPKPGSSNSGTPVSTPGTPDFGASANMASLPPGQDFSALPPSPQLQNLPPTFEGPKLKDYLPFMKPRSFGPKAGVQTPQDPVPASPTIPPEIPSLDSGDYNNIQSQKYPGLDPNLASVLPATLAQYLASVSSGAVSMSGAARTHSPSPSPSPQPGRAPSSPRHTPSPRVNSNPPSNPAMLQGPQSGGLSFPQMHSGPAHQDFSRIQANYFQPISQNQPGPASQPNLTASHMQPNSAVPAKTGENILASGGYPQQMAVGGPTTDSNPSLPQQPEQKQHPQQAYQQYGYIPGLSHPQQYPNMTRHDNMCVVSAVSRPIFCPGQESLSQAPYTHPHQHPPSHPQALPGQQQQPSLQQQQPMQGQQQQQMPQYPAQQQYQQQHGGQVSFQTGQQPGPTVSIFQQEYGAQQQPLSSGSQQQNQPQQWMQNQHPGGGVMSSGQVQMGVGQGQQLQHNVPDSLPQTGGQLASVPMPGPGQAHGASGYGVPSQIHPTGMEVRGQPVNSQHFQPQQQIPHGSGHTQPQGQGLASAHGQGQNAPGFAQQQMNQQPGVYAGAMPRQMGGNQQGMDGSDPQSRRANDGTQQGMGSDPINPPHQSPTRNAQSRVPTTSVGYRLANQKFEGPFSADFAYPNQQWYQQHANTGNTMYQATYKGGYQHSIDRSYQNAQIYGEFTSKALMYGQSSQPISTRSETSQPQMVFSTGQGPISQPQVPQMQGQGFGSQPQGQHPQVQGQDGLSQGQMPQTPAQNQSIPQGGQGHPPPPGNIPQMQQQQFPNQIPPYQQQQGMPNQAFPQQRPQGPQQMAHSQPTLQHQQQPDQTFPQQQPPPQMQQQQQALPFSQGGQPRYPGQPGVMAPGPRQGFQPPPQQRLQQPHQHMQPQQQPHQQMQQPHHQNILQQGIRQYGPHQQLGAPGSSQQVLTPQPSGLHKAVTGQPVMPSSMSGVQVPLQPVNMPGGIQPGTPRQVLSRPSTPGSQVSVNVAPTPPSPIGNKRSVSRQVSSLDELLSSSPNAGVKGMIIEPQVLTDQERQLQKEEAMKNQTQVPVADPYSSQGALHKLLSDVESFGKFVDELSVTILGVSRLDQVWKSLLDSQDTATKKMSMAIARCYPMKNRDPDIMPYDETRVILATTKDDYVNASWLNDLSPSCPKFITTQAPMALTMGEFWAMVYEQGSEVLVQITSEYETGKKYPVYYPTEKDKPIEQGVVLLSLQSVKFRQHWVERIIHLKNTQTKQGRTVVHLQYKNWPVSGFPDDVSSIVHFISEVHSFYMQQRSLTKPVIVHCGSGIGRTGVFTLVYTAMQEIVHGNGLVDIPGLAKRMLQKRRGILHKKEQLNCCYEAVLCFAEEFLQKRGVLVKNPHFSQNYKVSRSSPKHQPHPVSAQDDIVLGSVDLQTIRENVGRLHVHTSSTDVDKKEEFSGSLDQTLSKKSLESLSSISNSSLPDVVQQYPDTQNHSEQEKIAGGIGSRSSSLSSIPGPLNPQMGSGPQNINTGLTQMDPNMMMLNPNSSLGIQNQQEGEQPGSSGSLPPTLAQLQDPETFSMGSPEPKKKNKITKSNFNQAQGSLQNTQSDPTDPFGSLDPLWSLNKGGK